MRVRTGEAELHENWSDEIVVRSVRIRLIIGGELLGKHPFGTMPGEFHGSGVAGKQSFDPGPGDVIDIPANIPHWMQVVGKDPAKVLIYKG